MILGQDSFAIAILGVAVMVLDQKPIVALGLVFVVAHTHQHPAAFELLAVQHEFEIALGQHLFGIAVGRPEAAIPQKNRAAAILALGNGAFEIAIIEGMILKLHRQALFGGIERRPACHRPGAEHPVQLQPKIVMQPCGGMLLDHKALALCGRRRAGATGIGSLGKIPHRLVSGQRRAAGFLFGWFTGGHPDVRPATGYSSSTRKHSSRQTFPFRPQLENPCCPQKEPQSDIAQKSPSQSTP